MPALVRDARTILARPTPGLASSDLDPFGYRVSTGSLTQAAAYMPPDAVYTMVVGHDPPLGDLEFAVQPSFELWLLPRRYTPSLHRADWVIAYHEPVDRVHVRVARVISLGSQATLLEVAR